MCALKILVTSEQTERSSYYQSYMGRLVDIQTALKILKKSEKIETKFNDHFWTSWIVINEEPAWPWPGYLTVYFS